MVTSTLSQMTDIIENQPQTTTVQQQRKLAPIRARVNQTQIKGKPSAANLSAGRTQSPNAMISHVVQPQPQGKGLTQANMTASIYQSQTASSGNSTDLLKIVRPAAQPKNVFLKSTTSMTSIPSGNQANDKTVLASTGNAQTLKLSHFPTQHNQIKNLESMVTQQANAESSLQQAGTNISASSLGTTNVGFSFANSNVVLANSASTGASGTQTNGPTVANQSVALQQLFRLSQAAAQSTADAVDTTAKEQMLSTQQQLQNAGVQALNIGIGQQTSATSQNTNEQSQILSVQLQNNGVQILSGKQNQSSLPQNVVLTNQSAALNSGGMGLTQHQLMQQVLKAANDGSLLPKQQQQAAENIRASIIGQSVQNIISRQNASKQGSAKQGRASPQAPATISQEGSPVQLFMPKQLSTSQLLELQQKLLAGKIMQKMQAVQPKPISSQGETSVGATSVSLSTLPSTSNMQTVTLKQIPAGTLLSTSQQSNVNQFVMPIATQGMQFFLQTNVAKGAGDNSQQSQIGVVSGSSGAQRINLPIFTTSTTANASANIVKQVQLQQQLTQKSNATQGVRIQGAAAPNIVVKPLDVSAGKVISDQQKAIQTKKLQQLLLQLTPSQRNLLVKKQQEFVSKGQAVPLMKLIVQVKQETESPKLVSNLLLFFFFFANLIFYNR